MAFTKQSSASANKASDNSARNKVGGYLNINIHTAQGVKRLGGSGIQLRETHPLEKAILDFCKEHPDRIQELTGRIELSFGEATPEGTVFDLGL